MGHLTSRGGKSANSKKKKIRKHDYRVEKNKRRIEKQNIVNPKAEHEVGIKAHT